jgi:uncharacterized protein
MPIHPFLESISTEARALLLRECASPTNRFGAEFFDEHLVVVVDFASTLARRLGADPFVVEIAAWLHDRAAVLDFASLPTHAHDGATLARSWLAQWELPEPLRERIASCIETHGTPATLERATPEQRCLANADVLSHLTRPAYWFWYLYHGRSMDLAGARAWYRSRLSLWNVLEPDARELVEAEYATLRRLLEGDDTSLAQRCIREDTRNTAAT